MEWLIHDLADAARIEVGHLPVAVAERDVALLVREAVERLRPLAEEKALVLTAEVPPGLPALCCDGERILQVLANLVGNAVKFTPERGAITVRVRPAPGAVQVEVADTGAGISEASLPHVFERYWQEVKGDRRGTGLGLYIAKGIVEAHGGRIWAESQVGRGTRVAFLLPAADADRRRG